MSHTYTYVLSQTEGEETKVEAKKGTDTTNKEEMIDASVLKLSNL